MIKVPGPGKERIHFLLEVLAVAFSLAYTILYAKGFVICWLFAFLASTTYVYLCVVKRIYAEALLQAFYVYMAYYGFSNWGGTWIEGDYSIQGHGYLLLASAAAMLAMGYFLKKNTEAAMPYIDSFTTCFSVAATILMVNYVHENWLYWIVIDAVAIYLYYKRGLRLTSLLFVAYFVLAIMGYFRWM